ncbi:hypothetical protein AB5N19_07714 [Seiridium cardinale]|uniref:protoporphyrinogen oxidase n=1 Tax=Seiridium cardinale TaxID=138064 RepID=A0ABR2X7J2_9PEZI
MASKHPEELFIALLRSTYGNACHGLVKRRPATAPSKLPTAGRRGLSYLALSRTRPVGAAQVQRLSATLGTRRGHATAEQQPKEQTPPRQIAVLGGGITGLTAAHYLARHATNAHITLYEASDRLGGWIHGEPTKVAEGADGEVLMQRGPRMLRSGATSHKYDDLVLYDVLANLKLQDKIIYPKGAAETRYIYYPDHLVRLPKEELSFQNIVNTIRSFLTEPLWTGCFTAGSGWAQHFNRDLEVIEQRRLDAKDVRTAFGKDESVAEFLGRVFGNNNSPVIKNIVSAMLHGIYGGDVHKLSAKHTIFEKYWQQSMFPLHSGQAWVPNKEHYLHYDIMDGPNRHAVVEMAEKARTKNLLAFSDGLVTLVDALAADLTSSRNVTVKTGTPASAVELQGDKVVVRSGSETSQYDQALSTLFSGHLAQLAQPANSLPSLAATEAVSIMVVNLWYPNADLLQNNPGFGYLIPQSVPSEENPEYALGVLFDSDIDMGNDTHGTKLTVMLGGHYWNDWAILPDEETGVAMARAVLERHLGISPEEEVKASAKLCRDCIPQHTVGHLDRLRKAHYELSSAFQGKLMVAGPSYTSVGVIPAMRAGYDTAMRLAKGHGQPWFQGTAEGDRLWDNSMWDLHFQKLEKFSKEVGITMSEPLVSDHVGTTGLEWASEDQAKQMGEFPVANLWFKKWTKKSSTLLDAEGNWTIDKDTMLKPKASREGTPEARPKKYLTGNQEKK